jgi:sigma-B regulation protein RsbQ
MPVGDAALAPQPDRASLLRRNNVSITGKPGARPMVFAHGYGCDQNMWRFLAPAFTENHCTVLFDHVGFGRSDLAAYDRERYATLHGFAEDVVELLDAFDLNDVVFVGHSVSAMIGALAAIRAPARFGRLVMIGPSPRYVNEPGYHGGFERTDIEGLLDLLDSNHLGWSAQMAPVIMGNPERPELAQELTNSFCRTDPEVARHFARVTFLSDNRADLPQVPVRSQVLQCSQDVIAPDAVGDYVHRHLPDSRLVRLRATGHCPNLSAPAECIAAIRGFLAEG